MLPARALHGNLDGELSAGPAEPRARVRNKKLNVRSGDPRHADGHDVGRLGDRRRDQRQKLREERRAGVLLPGVRGPMSPDTPIRTPLFQRNFEKLVLGCIDTSDSENGRTFSGFSRSTRFTFLCTAQISKFQQKSYYIFLPFFLILGSKFPEICHFSAKSS